MCCSKLERWLSLRTKRCVLQWNWTLVGCWCQDAVRVCCAGPPQALTYCAGFSVLRLALQPWITQPQWLRQLRAVIKWGGRVLGRWLGSLIAFHGQREGAETPPVGQNEHWALNCLRCASRIHAVTDLSCGSGLAHSPKAAVVLKAGLSPPVTFVTFICTCISMNIKRGIQILQGHECSMERVKKSERESDMDICPGVILHGRLPCRYVTIVEVWFIVISHIHC